MEFNAKKMTAKQFKAAQEKLGYDNQAFATVLNVSLRSVVGWREKGASQLASMAVRYILIFKENAESLKP